MATIAEQLIGSALESSTKAPDITGSIERGVGLAQAIQRTQMQRQELEAAKEVQYVNKVNRVVDAIEKGSAFKDKAAQNMYFKNYIPGMVKALKLEEFFTPETMQFVQGSPEVRDKLIGLRLDIQDKITNGQLRGAQILEYAKSKLNPEELASLDTESLLEQQKFAMSEAGKTERASMVQTGQAVRQATQIGSAGQTALAQDLAKKFAEYKAAGGKAAMTASLKKLREASEALKTGRVSTGDVTTRIPGFNSDIAQATLNPKMSAMKTQAQGALNTVLRATLGAQFTAQEGERVLNQIWDDKQPPRENAKRLDSKIAELQSGLKDQEEEYKRFGYLKPDAPSAADKKATAPDAFDDAQLSKALSSRPSWSPEALQMISDKYKIPLDRINKVLKGAKK